MAGLLIFGVISYLRMGISQLPDVDFPVVTIQVTWPGAAPDIMESAVADVIEDAIMNVDGIKLVTSSSQQGMTNITIQFQLEQDIDAALLQVQTKISQAQKNLPQTIDPPILTKSNPNDQPIMWVSLYDEKRGPLRDISVFTRGFMKDSLTSVSGVGDLRLGGYLEPQMRIWLNPDKMAQKEMTSLEVIDAVNLGHQIAPTGYQDSGSNETYVRLLSEFRNAEECNNLFIPTRGGLPNFKPLQIKDIGFCEEGTDEVRRISRYNGIEPAIGLGIIKQPGTNAVAIGDAVKEKVKELRDLLPKNLKLEVVTDTTVFIKEAVNELLTTLGFAVILTSIVCYLFLGSFSSALNVILAIPVSLIGTFIVLNAMGFTVNSFTLMGLSLSIGIVVDDAIMVLENISRHVEEGKNRVAGAIIGTREITGAATAATIAILAIFMPVVFMEGIVGKFFFQFGVTLSVAVAISLLEALTLAPMRCSQFLQVGKENKVTKKVSQFMDWLAVQYKKLLVRCLHWRWTVIIGAVIFFVASLFTVGILRKEFLPPQDQSRFLVTLYTKMGSSISYTDSVFKKAEAFMKSRPEIERYYVAVGGFGGGLVNQGISFVTMKEPKKRGVKAPFKKAPTQQEFMNFLRTELEKIKEIDRVSMLDLSLTGFSAQRGYPIEFVLQGPDWEKLGKISTDMMSRLKKSGLMADVDSDYQANMPELELVPDRAKATQYGVPVTNIGSTLSSTVAGKKLLPNKYSSASGHRDDIQVKLEPSNNTQFEDIKKVLVRNITGEVVPLANVLTAEESNTLLTITRYNRQRGISIFGNFKPGVSQSEVMDYVKAESKKLLPKGYHLEVSGSSEAFGESFRSLIFALLLGIAVSYMVLASQFNSFVHPFVILLALPFSMSGAFGAMALTDTSLNIYSLIGILLLMGIVKKNSILLVEFTNHKRKEGMNVRDALIHACPVRLRPILMTSIATIAGAVPAALAVGSGAEVMRPMAITVIGGVFVSTLLTLFVVPSAYSLCSRLENKKQKQELEDTLKEMNMLEDDLIPPKTHSEAPAEHPH